MLLSEDDVIAVAEAIEPGSSAAVLVWENVWAAPFASALRRAGGQLVASGRIPIQALLAVIEADDDEEFDDEEADDEEAFADAASTSSSHSRRESTCL